MLPYTSRPLSIDDPFVQYPSSATVQPAPSHIPKKQRKEEHLVAIWLITTNYLSYSLINNNSYQPPNEDGYSNPLILQYFIENRYLKLRILPFNCSPHCGCIRVVPAVCQATSRPVPSVLTIADQSRPVPVRCTLHKFKICLSYDTVFTIM
jgi:hypothetical protein